MKNVSFTPGDSFHNSEEITAIIEAAATGERKANKVLRQGGRMAGAVCGAAGRGGLPGSNCHRR